MSTRPEALSVINQRIFPAILGRRLFVERPATTTEMAYGETAMFQALCSNVRPSLAIEIGTETGGTLATIARYSSRAISIDIDPGVKQRLAPHFKNVDFLSGSSHDILPPLLEKLAAGRVTPDFIFVDGDHSAAGVRRDLELILSFRPLKQMLVLTHDSFNPHCRAGILSAPWERNPYCHFIELDFVPGILHPNDNCLRQMWGGLALAVFLPEPRRHALEVKATHEMMFEAAFRHSVYQSQPMV